MKNEEVKNLGRPFYKFCRVCEFEAKFCEERENHMEKRHGLTGDELKRMILVPRLWFSRQYPEKLMSVEEVRSHHFPPRPYK